MPNFCSVSIKGTPITSFCVINIKMIGSSNERMHSSRPDEQSLFFSFINLEPPHSYGTSELCSTRGPERGPAGERAGGQPVVLGVNFLDSKSHDCINICRGDSSFH